MAAAQSNTYPKIIRLQGVILYPCNITNTTCDEMGNVIYCYDEYAIPDTGQLLADRELFVKENWVALQAAAMNDHTASPKIVETWEVYLPKIETKFNPAPTAEALAEAEEVVIKVPIDEVTK